MAESLGFNTYKTLTSVSQWVLVSHCDLISSSIFILITVGALEKVFQNQATGEGIKRVPCYETPLTKHELEKWRKEFWETRTQGSQHIWQLLRNACEETPETAQALILAAGLQMPQNSLTLVIDENGVYYRVPICCIAEPMNYSVNYVDQKLKTKQKPAEKLYKVS